MKSVVICASNRFAKEAETFAAALKEKGVVVLVPHFYRAKYEALEEKEGPDKKFVALGLTLDHFQKIRRADVVFMYNKDGYIGNSTTLELGYATALGKPVYALSDKDPEICRDILFEEYVSTPDELIRFLN